VKILITGGAGFIGSHLAEFLLQRGDEVWIIDDLSTGRLQNIQHLRSRPQFHLTVETILNETVMDRLVSECEVIYHLAAAVGVELIVKSPVETIERNVLGSDVVLRLANRYLRKVLITSTSEIYGKSDKVPFREDDDRMRLFNTVGPRQTGRYGMVIPRLVQQALAGKPLTVYGDGKQVRCFTYVQDVVRAATQLMDSPIAVGQVFNIGNDKPISIIDLAKKIKALTKSDSEIRFVPYDQAYEEGFEDMTIRVPDLTKARTLIGYEPRVDLDEILQAVVEHFIANQGHE